MAEQVKYTEQERMEAFDFLEAQMALKTPMREWGLNLAAKLHSVRAEAQRAILVRDFSGVICPHCGKAHDIEITGLIARLAAAEKLAEDVKALLDSRHYISTGTVDATEEEIQMQDANGGWWVSTKRLGDVEASFAAWKEAAGK